MASRTAVREAPVVVATREAFDGRFPGFRDLLTSLLRDACDDLLGFEIPDGDSAISGNGL